MNPKPPMLVPLTRRTRKAALTDRIALDAFPFRIGREARLCMTPWHMKHGERREGTALPNNDLYLEPVGRAHYISREHVQIERRADGSYWAVDRGSICGTTVGNRFVGGTGTGGSCLLADGDELILGSSRSPYRFRFTVRAEESAWPAGFGKRGSRRVSHALLGVAALIVVAMTIVVHGFML